MDRGDASHVDGGIHPGRRRTTTQPIESSPCSWPRRQRHPVERILRGVLPQLSHWFNATRRVEPTSCRQTLDNHGSRHPACLAHVPQASWRRYVRVKPAHASVSYHIAWPYIATEERIAELLSLQNRGHASYDDVRLQLHASAFDLSSYITFHFYDYLIRAVICWTFGRLVQLGKGTGQKGGSVTGRTSTWSKEEEQKHDDTLLLDPSHYHIPTLRLSLGSYS